MKAQQQHNPDGYYLMQVWQGRIRVLTRDSWTRMANKHNNPEFTLDLDEAVLFTTVEDAHAAFRECAMRLRLTTLPTDYELRSVSHEEAVLRMVGTILAE